MVVYVYIHYIYLQHSYDMYTLHIVDSSVKIIFRQWNLIIYRYRNHIIILQSISPSLMQYSAISARTSLALLELAFMVHSSFNFHNLNSSFFLKIEFS